MNVLERFRQRYIAAGLLATAPTKAMLADDMGYQCRVDYIMNALTMLNAMSVDGDELASVLLDILVENAERLSCE